MNLEVLERLSNLPPKLSTSIRTCYVEAGDKVLAPLVEWREKRNSAQDAAWAWINAKGGIGYFPPNTSWGRGERHALAFCFATKPTGSAWKDAPRNYRPDRGVGVTPSRSRAGKALSAEIEALPAWPGDHQAIDLLGPPCTIRYTSEGGGKGFTTVGSDGGRLFFSTAFYCGDRFFIGFPNPFYDLAALASSESEFYAGAEFEESLLEWRPAEGWELLTKGEVELIFAKAKVEAEAQKAAA